MRYLLVLLTLCASGHLIAQIGLNTQSPQRDIDASGSMRIFYPSTGSTTPHLDLEEVGGTNKFNRLKFSNNQSSGYWMIATRATDTATNTEGRFNIYHPMLGNALVLKDNNRLGLGVSNPTDFFHINAKPGENVLRIQSNGVTRMRLFNNGSLSIGTNNQNISDNDVYIHHDLGIGVSQPQERLEVAGKVKMDGLILNTSPVAGHILTSDANGEATWQAPPSSGAESIDDLSDAKKDGNSLFLGTSAGYSDDGSSNRNIGIGDYALRNNTTGMENVVIGQSNSYNNNGSRNVVVGYQADYKNQQGWNNTLIGAKAGGGGSLHTKSGNVFIGNSAGYNETGSNLLYIHNNNSSSPLIWGNFSSGQEEVKINGDFKVEQNSTATINNLKIPNNPTDGYVLTSDASGNASWQEVPSGNQGDTDWYFDGSGIYRTGDVSIGISSYSFAKFYVKNSSTNESAVHGSNWASGYGVGVKGTASGAATSSASAIGVFGEAASGVGVQGRTSNIGGIAVLGTLSGTLGTAGRFEGPVEVTGKLSIGANPSPQAYKLVVDGSAGKNSGGTTWANLSDKRLKDIQGDYKKGLNEINALHTVVFNYKKDNPLKLPSEEIQYGFIAQEVQKIYPEAIGSADGKYLDFNFHPILVSMVNAFQELSDENEHLKNANEALKSEMELMKSQLAQLANRMASIEQDLD